MSKVVHLSDEAHDKAKLYCKKRGLKMSDWVAQLIDATVDGDETPSVRLVSTAPPIPPPRTPPEPARPIEVNDAEGHLRSFVPKKKSLERVDEAPQTSQDGMPLYAEPPFWVKAKLPA